jgi:sugar phosphate isomerase/epimerase
MVPDLTRRDVLTSAMSLAGAGTLAGAAARGVEKKPTVHWPLYAFDNGLRDVKGVEAKVKLLKDLGYAGIEYHLDPAELPKMLEALDKHGLKMFGMYTVPTLEQGIPDNWGDWIKLLKGRPTRIEMAIRSKKVKSSDPAGDKLGVAMVKKVSDFCGDTGPVVSIYPHTRNWTERVEDGVRMAKLSGRKNVGTNFNLVHWQWVKQTRPLEEILAAALPHLFLVTLNGLKGPKDSKQKIRPLDESDYDLAGFLKLVKKVGYTGPVGLQCWSIKDPAAEHLKRSIATWRTLLEQVDAK